MKPKRRKPKAVAKPLAVTWTERAQCDLEAIGDFIASDNPVAARRWVDTLMATAKLAGAYPLAGRRVPELGRDEIREVLKQNYRIVYRVKRDRIEILTVFERHRWLPKAAGRK